jgi:hypothetical protein
MRPSLLLVTPAVQATGFPDICWKLVVIHRIAALQDATGIAADNTAQKTEEGKAAAAVKKVPDPSYSPS